MVGKFLLVLYDRDTEAYTLVVDDGQRSSFRFNEWKALSDLFTKWGLVIGNEAIDAAREFGNVQVVFGDRLGHRIIRLRKKQVGQDPVAKLLSEEPKHVQNYLPSL